MRGRPPAGRPGPAERHAPAGDRAAGLDGLITVVFVITSIALGTLVGATLYKWLSESFGRVGSYLRRAKKS